MRTNQQVYDDCNRAGFPCAYHGDKPEWLAVLGQSRDSCVLERSNFETACKMLEDIDPECYAIERASHWAVGWVETLLVDPTNAQAVACAKDIQRRIEDYPILDEEHYSDLERAEFEESWDAWGRRDFQVELAKRYDGYPRIFNVIYDLDADAVDNLWFDVAQRLNWEYQADGSGVTININGGVDAVDQAKLLGIVRANRPRYATTLRPYCKYCEGQGVLFDV